MKYIKRSSKHKIRQRIGCLIVFIVVTVIGSTILYHENFLFRMFVNYTGCLLLGKCEYNQPLLTKNIKSIRNFSDSTSFPYYAKEERRESILATFKSLQVGMSGDDVLNVMGNPDYADMLAFVGDPPRGWVWDYYFNKKSQYSTDETDTYITVYFDINGKVNEVKIK